MKDMSQLGRRIEDVILIDNSPNSYRLQPENAIPIISWFDDLADRELYRLTPLLVGLSRVPDVREVLGKVHADHNLDLSLAESMVTKILKEAEQRQRKDAEGLNSEDFDLNDRQSDNEDIFEGIDFPPGQQHSKIVPGGDSGSSTGFQKKVALNGASAHRSSHAARKNSLMAADGRSGRVGRLSDFGGGGQPAEPS